MRNVIHKDLLTFEVRSATLTEQMPSGLPSQEGEKKKSCQRVSLTAFLIISKICLSKNPTFIAIINCVFNSAREPQEIFIKRTNSLSVPRAEPSAMFELFGLLSHIFLLEESFL